MCIGLLILTMCSCHLPMSYFQFYKAKQTKQVFGNVFIWPLNPRDLNFAKQYLHLQVLQQDNVFWTSIKHEELKTLMEIKRGIHLLLQFCLLVWVFAPGLQIFLGSESWARQGMPHSQQRWVMRSKVSFKCHTAMKLQERVYSQRFYLLWIL